MGEHLFCAGQTLVTNDYKDGWIRSFKGYPDMNDDIRSMLHDYVKKGQYASVLIFFVDKAGLDNEYSGFLLREMIRGYL